METHRYWGIYGGASGPFISGPMRIAEVEFRNYVDGTNLVGSGTVAYPFGGYGDPSGAFDGDPDTDYVSSNQTNAIVGYDFGAPVTVREIALQASQTVPEKMPGIWAIMYSDDGDEWFEEEEFREIADWSAGEIRTIVLDATPDPGGGGGGDGARLEIAHNLITRTGFAGIRLRHVVREFGRSSLALNHSIVIPEGRAVLPVRHQLQAFGPSVLPVRHQVQAPQTGERWQIAVQLDGVDVTDQLNGAVRIEANKSAARIADFVLRPDPGPIDTQAFIKQPVVIDFSTFTASNLQTSHRRFTGIVDDATFDPVSRLISFVCTDDLQGSVEALDFDVIDSVIGGDYSPLIFQRTDNGWEYAQQRLQSQPFSYDKNVFGQPRKWAWQSKAVPDVTVPLIQVIDGSLSHTQSKSRDVVNHVRLEFVHRYGRLWQRELDLVWTYGRSFKDYLFLPSELPNREMFINAIDSTWWVKSLSFTKLPPSGTYPTSGGGLSNWVISDSLRESLIFGARAVLARRWIQDVQEVYHVDVVAPASVDRFGESRVNRRYFSDVPVNERYEDVRGSVPSSSSMGGLSGSAYRPPIAGSVQVADHFYFDDDARADLESALSAAVNIAKTEILASHHLNEVTFSTLLNPFVDLGMTVAVDAQTITATGTVGKLVETYDIASGRAHSEISVNVYGPNISGQSETGALPPARPDVAPALVSDDIPLGTHLGGLPNSPAPSAEWRGFLGNYSAANSAAFDAFRYPHEFRIETPGVDDALRLIASAERSSRYTVAIPQESISIIA